jgi:uncharacterized protein YfcZ (UPF0381/DUF406 family)
VIGSAPAGSIPMTLRAWALATAAVSVAGGAATASESSMEFALNVSRHVVLHEFGHALIREFDLPVLGNEEDMADTFATVFITQEMRDDAVAILKDRARSWLYEGSQVAPEDYDLAGEHELDTRRAFRTVCLLYGADPAVFSEVVAWIGLSEGDANDCSDIAPDVIEGWERVLAPYRLAEGGLSDKVIVQHGEANHTAAVRQSGLLEEVAEAMRRYDWPHPVRLHFDSCGREGSSWSRTERRILICDEYFDRFVRQQPLAPPR